MSYSRFPMSFLAEFAQLFSRRTIAYYLMFFTLGIQLASVGPTLQFLADHISTDVANLGTLFTFSAIGYAIGTFAGGWVFDHFKGHPVLAICNLSGAILIAIVPLADSLLLLLIVFLIKGALDGLIGVGANTLLVWSYREKTMPYMNCLHLCFGVGAFVGPFIVSRLLSVDLNCLSIFWIESFMVVLVGLYLFSLKDNPRIVEKKSEELDVRAATLAPFVITAALFLFFYVGAEVGYASWISNYVISLNLLNSEQAALLASLFWFAFVLGRTAATMMGNKICTPKVVYAACFSSMCLLVLWWFFQCNVVFLWIFAAGFGFLLGPIWPTGYSLAGQSVRLTGKLNGMILLGDSLGFFVVPTFGGKIMARYHAQALIFLILGSITFSLVSFLMMLRFKKPLLTDQRGEVDPRERISLS